ncbi:MAG TPA: hypothetical protein VM782_16340 [Stellaceae bacterium]|nr:hypothetical protein [Stellaceae bacterium]
MFVRFVIKQNDPDSGRRQGLFQAAAGLREVGTLTAQDHHALERIRDWFNTNLERPTRLALSPRPHRKAQALSWFKDTATQHIAKMREYQKVLERYGLQIEMITAARPGYVLYEDEFQVAAYPFRDTPA